MLRTVTENSAITWAVGLLTLSLTLAAGCDKGGDGGPSNGNAADTGQNGGAAAGADAGSTDTAAKIEASHQRTGLDKLPADIPSHHLTEYSKHLDKPAATGPHGGTLITLSEQTVIEFVLDRDSGGFTAHVMDATGQPVAIRQDKVKLHIYWSSDMDPRDHEGFAELRAILRPAADAVTAEGAATFQTQDRDFARRPGQFILKIEKLTVGDQTVEWSIYHFPAGIPWQPQQASDAK